MATILICPPLLNTIEQAEEWLAELDQLGDEHAGDARALANIVQAKENARGRLEWLRENGEPDMKPGDELDDIDLTEEV